MVADSEHDANMLYAVGMFVSDPVIYLRARGEGHVVVSDSEFARVRRQATGCKVIPLNQYERKLKKKPDASTFTAHIVRLLLRERALKKVFVPPNFPHGLARQIRRLNVRLKVKEGEFFPQREIKSAEEVKKISAALIMAEVGMAEAIQALKNSKPAKDGRLIFHHLPLTADKLRSVIDTAIIQAGGLPNHTVVACGKQSCDPHERGHGVLRANQPIVLKVAPRSRKTGYFGDIARTVVRGRASDRMRDAFQAVVAAQNLAFSRLLAKIACVEVHRAVQQFFEAAGYESGRSKGTLHGFFEPAGHGLGLENEETPILSANSRTTVKPGQVVTIAPSLCYPSLGGGVWLEDVALVTSNGARNLTKFEKILEV
jgi:Xaa-Pro aminopeptidase